MKYNIIKFWVFFVVISLIVVISLPGIEAKYSDELDPNEGSGGGTNNPWSFYWGESNTYGAYLRDVCYRKSGGSTQLTYIGMVAVPWIDVDGIIYEVPDDMTLVTKYCNNYGGGANWEVWFWYSFTSTYTPPFGDEITINHGLEISYDLHTNAVTQNGNRYGLVRIRVLHYTDYSKLYSLEVGFRIDFDIGGATNDMQYEFLSTGYKEVEEEKTRTAGSPYDSDGCKFLQDDMGSSNQAAIEPWNQNDNIYYVCYNDGEFDSHPSNYLDSENLVATDDVVWWSCSDTTTGESNQLIDLKLWLF